MQEMIFQQSHLLEYSTSISVQEDHPHALVALQAVHNCCVGHQPNQVKLWDAWFPAHFRKLFELFDPRIYKLAAAILHLCTVTSPLRLAQLFEAPSASTEPNHPFKFEVTPLNSAVEASTPPDHPAPTSEASAAGSSQIETDAPTAEHQYPPFRLLVARCAQASAATHEPSSSSASNAPRGGGAGGGDAALEWLIFIVHSALSHGLFQHCLTLVGEVPEDELLLLEIADHLLEEHLAELLDEGPPHGLAMWNALAKRMQSLYLSNRQNLCARVDLIVQLLGTLTTHPSRALRDSFLQVTLVESAVIILRALVAQQAAETGGRVMPEDGRVDERVYGQRRNLTRLVGNLVWGHEESQAGLRRMEGLQLLLGLTKLDANNPFIREWALFAMRNALIDNEENQQVVASLQAQGFADPAAVQEILSKVRRQDQTQSEKKERIIPDFGEE